MLLFGCLTSKIRWKTIQSLLLLVIALAVVLGVGLNPTPIHAQADWPPFLFALTPTYADGQITYELFFVSYLEPGAIADLAIHIPLPEGTRYLEGSAQDSTTVSFDGQEVEFFTASLSRNALSIASFVVEVVDPELEVYTTQPWLAWGGQQPGDYLADPVSIDITKPVLPWVKPIPKHLMLEAGATVGDDLITYYLFPGNVEGRMWDVTVNLPIPEGVTLLSADAPPPFVASFDGREVSFKAVELPKGAPVPLQVEVSTSGLNEPALVTYAWAGWRNVGPTAGTLLPPKSDTRTADLVVQPRATGWVVADEFGDVPFSNYDVASLAVQAEETGVDVIFYTRDDIGPTGQPLLFVFYLNTDCESELEYRLLYSHRTGLALLQSWNAPAAAWEQVGPVQASHAGPRMLVLRVPKALLSLDDAQTSCGLARVINASQDYRDPLDVEAVPNASALDTWLTVSLVNTMAEERINMYAALGQIWQELPELPPPPTPDVTPGSGDAARALAYAMVVDFDFREMLARDAQDLVERVGELVEGPLDQRVEKRPALTATRPTAAREPVPAAPASPFGTLAVPINNGQGSYDLYLFAVPTGQEIARVSDAHQPDFNYDGQRLLFDREGYGVNFVYEYDLATNTETPVTDIPNNEHPVYDLWGNRVAYGNTGLALGQPEWALDDNGDFDRSGRTITVEDALEILGDLDALPPEPPWFDDLPILPSDPIFLPPITPPGLVEKIREEIRDKVRDQVLGAEISIFLPYRVSRYRPFLYVQCSLSPSQQESDVRCRDVASQGKLYPDEMGEIQGRYPVWTASDQIVYNGCNTWSGSKLCGIFSVPAASTKGFSEGVIPVRLTDQPSDLPADSQGNLIAFTSQRDGNWEAYVMNLDGSQVLNLSQSPGSNDGLPAISPDGQWVAFVSDRSGRWAVWVVPSAGGEAMWLFDLPAENPWADGNRAWFNERLAWGGEAGDGPPTWEPPASAPDYLAPHPTPIGE